MSTFTSKELFMMNGGHKHYIGKDGFMDIYKATPEEEAEWSKELAEIALAKIQNEEDAVLLEMAIKNLAFQKYHDEVTVLINSIPGSSPEKQFALATALWDMNCKEEDFNIVFEILLRKPTSPVKQLFDNPRNYKKHTGAKFFLIHCLASTDQYLFQKAHTILYIWAWSGVPELRENSMLDRLQFYNNETPASKAAIERLKEILTTTN